MRSRSPKVLQPLAGKPLLAHVLATVAEVDAQQRIVVYGHGGDAVKAAFAESEVTWVEQAERLGTGHAVMQAMPAIRADAIVLVLYGDVPLVRAETLKQLVNATVGDRPAILTVEVSDPSGYGRVVRNDHGQVLAIVEEKDARDSQRAIAEINTGLLACPAGQLSSLLDRVEANNAQGEYYLTDIVGLAVADGLEVAAVVADNEVDVMGINDRHQLAEAEAARRERVSGELLDSGVTLADPARLDVRGTLECGQDVFIDVNVVFEGEVRLEDNVSVGPNCVVRDTKVGAGTQIHSHSILEQAEVGAGCEIGPFARVRPGSVFHEGAKLGNFVETKNTTLGKGSKASHLTYLGDAIVGAGVNVGAGTITCNYDGQNKNRTVIGDGAFIGSGVELVAPLEIGPSAYIAAGSTISRDAPGGKLTVARTRQVVVETWTPPEKVRKD
jgi:bifunctional UDP-N-acetylglucosamine pyrophosphorylase/glucosamine-1-phosphate N-acetyltransferase